MNQTNYNIYHFAGVLDGTLNITPRIEKRSKTKLSGSIINTKPVLKYIQSIVGGKVNQKNGNLFLYQAEMKNIAQLLKDIPCRLQETYKAIYEYNNLKSSFNPKTTDLLTYQSQIIELLNKIKLEYEKQKTELTNFTLFDKSLYFVGYTEANVPLNAYLHRKKILQFILSYSSSIKYFPDLKTKNISGSNLINFIKNNYKFFLIKKPIFGKILELSERKTQEDNSLLLQEYKDFVIDFENSSELIYGLTQDEVNQKNIQYRNEQKIKKQEEKLRRLKLKQEKREKDLLLHKQTVKERQNKRKQESLLKKQKIFQERKRKKEARKNQVIWEQSLVKENKCFCRKCKNILPVSDFSKSSMTKTGVNLYCKKCIYETHVKPNLEKYCNRTKAWQANNHEKVRLSRNKNKNLPHNKIRNNISNRVKDYLGSNSPHYKDIVSCSPKELKLHIESQFSPEMNWDNYGTYWHIDHIIPCAAFDMNNLQHLKWCWHHRNLRPLVGKDNMEKGDKLPTSESASYLFKNDKARLGEIIGELLEDQEIVSKIEYIKTLE